MIGSLLLDLQEVFTMIIAKQDIAKYGAANHCCADAEKQAKEKRPYDIISLHILGLKIAAGAIVFAPSKIMHLPT